jgi:hypothetical protein
MDSMHGRILIAAIASAAMLLTLNGARAFDDAKYPDWKGQWIGGWTKRFPGVTGQPSYDPHKSDGRGQQAPLTPGYQAVFETSLKDQAAGGPGNDPQWGRAGAALGSLPRLIEIARVGRRLPLLGRHQIAVPAHVVSILADGEPRCSAFR